MPRHGVRPAIAALLAALLAACGGGGDGGNATPVAAPPPAVASALNDNTAYSSAAGASLATSSELAVTSSRTLALAGTNVAYSASAGHLDSLDPLNSATKASMRRLHGGRRGTVAAARLLLQRRPGLGGSRRPDARRRHAARRGDPAVVGARLQHARSSVSEFAARRRARSARAAKIAESDRNVYR